MTNRVFHILERHQKLDERLRAAQARRAADPLEIARLWKLKFTLKDRLSRLLQPAALAR